MVVSKNRSENVLFLFSYIIGALVFGFAIGFVSLLISYTILTVLLNLDLIPVNFRFYGIILVFTDTIQNIVNWIIGWIF